MSLSNIPPPTVARDGPELELLAEYIALLTGELYFITLTLKPNALIFKDSGLTKSALQQFKMSALALTSLIGSDADHYVFVPELTKAGTIHWHGVLQIKNELTIPLIRDMALGSKVFGRSDFQPLKNKNDIIKYLSKDYKITYPIINRKNKKDPLDIIIWPSYEKKKINKSINMSMFVIDNTNSSSPDVDRIIGMFDDT